MSFLDKLVAAVTPPESEQDRAKARRNAEEAGRGVGWLETALQHHRQIESAFHKGKVATEASTRQAAFKELAVVLNGHSLAEEVVLYPNLIDHGEKVNATMAYEEQTATKVQMALLEKLDPMSQDWLDKWGHIEGAVRHHIYQEESTWFLDLARKSTPEESAMLTQRFREEYQRYAGSKQAADLMPNQF